MATLITGGTGYIGSHTIVELLKDGRDIGCPQTQEEGLRIRD